ncbi:hypothetical protein [Cellulomonas oligotrophica]|uniref:DUF1877 domain-containing protein n=1 Tax=Cellulomonas oligotrophica TaxID=931536 RepID=A0A7Y9FIQ7_9CELL|nr:hypothetical protein [Cellulomonas oligotrophica]NYD87732.1 hypothetical protein [Cellulomonas oligotrophica]GIG33063.1 hypothetical protein Col01nite_22220 [Cellulomonas oligotrophica]
MGVLCDYFVAPSDADAVATLDRVGGPGRPGADGAPAWPTLDAKGIDPFVTAGTLEQIVLGLDEEVDDPEPLATTDGGEGMVVPVSPRLVAALAAADDAALRDAAQAWSCTEELAASTAEDLLPVVRGLADLARQARQTRAGMYCWVSV